MENMNPYFHQIVFGDYIAHTLRIPPHFMKHLTKDMSDEATTAATINIASSHWPVKLRRRSDCIYIEDGWPRIMQDNALGDKEFLVFRYDGNMCFNLQIFEKTGCERDYATVNQENAEFLNSENLHFKKVMKDYHVQKSFLVRLPREFGAGLCSKSAKAVINLENSKGEAWEVYVILNTGAYSLSRGWREFVSANGIKVGDECIFELLSKTRIKSKLESFGDQIMENMKPYFHQIVFGDSIAHRLRIPPAFTKHLTKDMEDEPATAATIKIASNSWPVTLRKTSECTYIENGWPRVMQDNALGDKEFLVFRYDGNMCFNLQIFEKSGCERDYSTVNPPNPVLLNSENQQIKIRMKEYHVVKPFIVRLPKEFSKKLCSTSEKLKLTLENSRGEAWEVSATVNGGGYCLCGGWRAFVIANKVMVGDEWIFELLNKTTIRVHNAA